MSQSMSVEAVLSAYDESFSATLDKALKSIQNLNTSTSSAAKSVNSSGSNISDTFKAMAGAMGVMQIASGAFNLIKGSVGGAVKRLDTLNNATRTFSNMNFSTSQIQSAMNGLKESVKGLPTPLDQSVKGVNRLTRNNLAEEIGVSLPTMSKLINDPAPLALQSDIYQRITNWLDKQNKRGMN